MAEAPPLPAETEALLLRIVARTPAPLSTTGLMALLSGPARAARRDLGAHLARLAGQGRLHPWPGRGARAAPRYWHREPAQCLQEALAEIAAAGPLTAVQLDEALRRRLFGLSRRQTAALRAQALPPLLAAGRLFQHPPRGRFPVRFASRPADPRDYLAALRRECDKVCRKLARVGVPPSQVLAALAESMGASPPSSEMHAEPPLPDAAALLRAMEAVEPAARSQALVPVPTLRRALGLSKRRFDALILAMADGGRLFLHEHIHPGALSGEERDALVDDGQGSLVMGVVWREEGGDA